MPLESWPLDRLRPYDKNPRTHSADQIEQLARSIREFGFTNPILVDRDGVVIAGHGRLLAAKSLNLGEVPVIRLGHLSETQRRALVIADNQLALNSGWDEDLLSAELAALRAEDFDLTLVGFSDAELADLLPPEDGPAEEDSVPPPPAEPTTRPGDLYVLGKHRLLCGDSTRKEDVERLAAGELAACTWTDPPYGVDYVGKTEEALTIQNDGGENLEVLLRDAFAAVDAALAPGAAIYVAHPAGRLSVKFGEAFLAAGWRLHQTLVWVKDSMVLGHADYHYKHEPLLYGFKPGGGRRGRGGEGWYGDNSQVSTLEFARPKSSQDHPTMKPVALVEYCLANSSKRGDRVLDPFGGSGTTLIACERLGRAARLMEIDPRYCDVIVRRWEELTGGQAERRR